MRDDVEVIWVPSHRPKDAVTAGPQGRLHAFGNQSADRLAREATGWHPEVDGLSVAVSRTEELASRLGRFYARLLDRALEEGALPEPAPFYTVFRLHRPPPLPECPLPTV